MNTFDFQEQLVMSSGVSVGADIAKILLDHIPGAIRVAKANTRDDKSGTDYWIEHKRGTPISVDTKIRKDDPIRRWGRDDLALELESVVGKKVGWTLDDTKRTDYVLWWFAPTKRWVLVPFLQLQSAFMKRREEWEQLYGRGDRDVQFTRSSGGGWNSRMLLVPRREVWAAIYCDFGGSVRDTTPPEVRQEAKTKLADNVCEICEKAAIITIRVVDRVGPRTVCSRCWRTTQVNHAQEHQIGGR